MCFKHNHTVELLLDSYLHIATIVFRQLWVLLFRSYELNTSVTDSVHVALLSSLSERSNPSQKLLLGQQSWANNLAHASFFL